jgi:UDP-N-acetylmuramyl tripeptide synthase
MSIPVYCTRPAFIYHPSTAAILILYELTKRQDHTMNVKDIVSLWMGKAVAFGCRATRLGGSSLPGLLVTRVNPRFIGKAAGGHPHGDLVVTGTNGKTTTTRMIFGILREAGYRPVYNESGANLLSGIATTLVEDLSLSGRSKSDIGLFEVDEATTPRVCGDLKVAGLVITNISADQVDRFGELDHTLALIRQGLREMSKEAFLAVNADDPLVASLGAGSRCRPRSDILWPARPNPA